MKKTATRLPQDINPADLAQVCRDRELPVPESVVPALAAYISLLMRWGRIMNLVGAKNWLQALDLCSDSFYLARFIERLPLAEMPECWDLGAGAGLPGIPLRMVWQKGHYHMLEVREKRAMFLNEALARLNLPGTSAVCCRAETFFAHRLAQGCSSDCIFSRAFMPWEKLLPFAEPGLAPQGLVCIAANSPLPTPLPPGWRAVAQDSYTRGKAQRFFWALRRTVDRD